MTANTRNINAKSVAKYVFLPGVLPRVANLVGSGFGYLAFLFASIYHTVRILPAGHPFLNPDNIGKFGMLQVVAAAANNIEFKRKNLDQIVVFTAMLSALVLIFTQFALFLLAVFSGQAFATLPNGVPFTSIFVTPNPGTDIAFMLLDNVFGIPGETTPSFFGSNALAGGPTPFHRGLHALFNFYNLVILLIAVLIFLYYVVVVVLETAQTGVPFGKRFSKIYAPLRLIVAVGLLVPLNYGFNGAQYITLYAAKLGSSFATNGWLLYNDALAGGAGGSDASSNPVGVRSSTLVARPRTPSVDELMYFSSVYHACREMYRIWSPMNFQNPGAGGIEINAYVIANGTAQLFETYDYSTAKENFGNNDMEVVLGELNTTEHTAYAGGVRPYCGKLTISLSNDNPAIYTGDDGPVAPSDGGELSGIRAVEGLWLANAQLLFASWNENTFAAFGMRAAHTFVRGPEHNVCFMNNILRDGARGGCGDPNWFPRASVFDQQLNNYRVMNAAAIIRYYQQFRDNLNLALPAELRQRGWGGAGIWYNHIADINGTFAAAVYATPTVKQFPEVMEFVKRQRQVQDNTTGICETYDPNLADNKQVEFPQSNQMEIAQALNAAYKYHVCERPNQESGTIARPGGAAPAPGICGDQSLSTGGATRGMTTNTFINVVSIIFGINGLFDIRCNSEIDAATGMPAVHPLAQLATVGKSLVENAIRSMGMAVGAAFGGGILGVLNQSLGAALDSASGMFVGIATIGLTAGFVLYYILPFLPFMYFFFAVGSWVKSIFEAMVGVPLWALAHLNIEGEGLPGKSAVGGYFLILEIALRPIFTVFGLIGGMAVFGAMAVGLNNLFDLVVMNITGAPPNGATGSTIIMGSVESLRRGVIDQFFFTIMYALLLYMMATTSFKMIDQVPQNVMRWIGSSVPIFNDNKQDPTQGLTTYVSLAGNSIVPKMLSGVTGAARGLGGALGQAGDDISRAGDPPPATPATTPRSGGAV